MRRFSRRPVLRRTRKVDWGSAQVSATVAPFAKSSAYILNPTDVRTSFVSPTWIANRAFLNCLNAITMVGGGFAGVGLIRWTDLDNVAPTPADTPGVFSDGNMDWLARWVAPYPSGVLAGTLGNMNIFDNTHLSKAKRKLENSAGILCCFEVLAASSFNFACDFRFLIQQV